MNLKVSVRDIMLENTLYSGIEILIGKSFFLFVEANIKFVEANKRIIISWGKQKVNK